MVLRPVSSRLASLLLAGVVAAHGQVLSESFQNATTSDPNWVFSGVNFTPVLTGNGSIDAVGDGWLRLTDTGGNIATSAYNNTAFSAAGTTVYAEFEYASWGGSGADGIAFFLFDGSATFSVGANGGSLGYAQKTGVPGLAGGYIGVAIDEFGNFSAGTEGRVGGIGRTPDSISVRGDAASGYAYLGGSGTLANSIDTPNVGTRPSVINTVQILLTATNQLTVTLQQGALTAQTVLQLDLSSSIRPSTLKLGFTSGTGGANNFHEVRNVEASTIAASLWDNDTSDSTWGEGDNWDPNNVPGVGADILFDNTFVSTNQTIDTETDRTVRSIAFDAGFDYTLNNNTLIFDNGGVAGFSGINTSETNGSGDHTINSDLQADNDITIRNNNTGALTLNGDLDTGGNTITFDGTGDAASENGAITGTGDIIKNDSGTLTLTGANTYTGNTEINGGTVIIADDNALGTTGTGTDLNSGATLALTNNISVAETLANDGTLANTSGTNTFSGVVSGTGDVDVVGGQLTLTGNNTYAGTTDIASGATLVATNDNSLGTTAGGTTIDSGGTLSLTNNIAVGNEALTNNGTLVNTAGDNSFSGDITGSGGVTLTEGGLTLSGTNTYTGDTTINDGTISLGASNALGTGSDVTIASTGVLDLGGNSQAVGDLTAADGATLNFGSPGGANTFVFDTYTPPASGIFVVNNWEDGTDQLATTVATQDVTSVYLSGFGVAQQQTGLTALGGGYGSAYLLTPATVNAKEWDGSVNRGWRNDNNWTTPVEPNTTQIALFDDLGENQPLVNLNDSYTIAGIEFGSLGNAAYVIEDRFGQGNTLRLDGAIPYIQQKNALDQTIQIPGLILGNNTIADITGAGDLIISSPISEDSGDSNSFVRDGSGSGKLILSGDNTFSGGMFVTTGIVEAQSNNALGTGNTTVADTGTLELSNDITVGNNIITAGTGVGDDGAIRSTSGDNTLTGVVSGTGSVQVDADSLTLAGTNTYTGVTTVAGGTLIANNDNSLGSAAGGTTVETGGTLSLTNDITIATEGLNLSGTGVLENTSGDNEYGGLISGTGDINVVADSLTLSNTNTYSGDTDIATGTTLIATADDALGTGNLVINDGATLQLTGGIDVGQTNTDLAGTGISGNGAIENVSGDNRFSSDFTLTGDTTIVSDSGTLRLGADFNGSVYEAGNQFALGTNDLTFDGAGDTVLQADLTGTGNLIKDGAGTFTMANGTNSWTGETQINDGEMVLATYFNDAPGVGPLADFGIRGPVTIGDGVDAPGTATLTLGTNEAGGPEDFANMFAGNVDVTVNSDGRFDTQGHTVYVRDLELDGGSVNAQNSSSGGNNLFVTGDITSTSTTQVATIDGRIDLNGDAAKTIDVVSGSTLDINARIQNGGFDKIGDGTVILAGGNTFTGDANISNGIARVENNLGLGAAAGDTTVDTGAQLQLAGVSIANEALTLNGSGISSDGALQTASGSGANSWGGNVTVASASEIQTNSGSTLAISGNITGSGQTVDFDSIGDTTLSGTNTFSTLNKNGAGNLTVTTGTNTISNVNINDGTFTLGTSNILTDAMDMNIGAGGTLVMGSGINETIDGFDSAGTLDIDGILTMNGGTISGGTGVDSTGELILTAGNTLNITSDYDFGGTLELTAGTTLALSGAGSQIDFGTLRVTGDTVIDFGAGEAVEFNLGALEISPGVTITVNNWVSFQDLWTTGSFDGGFGSVTIDERDDNTAQITFTGFSPSDTIWLTEDFGTNEITVPEPSSYGAILMAFGLAAWQLRRPRRASR
jgi:fibronectin-binding autotransporter adhesin